MKMRKHYWLKLIDFLYFTHYYWFSVNYIEFQNLPPWGEFGILFMRCLYILYTQNNNFLAGDNKKLHLQMKYPSLDVPIHFLVKELPIKWKTIFVLLYGLQRHGIVAGVFPLPFHRTKYIYFINCMIFKL